MNNTSGRQSRVWIVSCLGVLVSQCGTGSDDLHVVQGGGLRPAFGTFTGATSQGGSIVIDVGSIRKVAFDCGEVEIQETFRPPATVKDDGTFDITVRDAGRSFRVRGTFRDNNKVDGTIDDGRDECDVAFDATRGDVVQPQPATPTPSATSMPTAMRTPTPVPSPTGDFDIEVVFLTSVTASQRRAFTDAANRWRTVVTGDLPDFDLDRFVGGKPANFCEVGDPQRGGIIDDVLIYALVGPIDGVGGTLAEAGPCLSRFDPDGRVVFGIMRFDVDDVDELEAEGGLFDTILHEMGHVLGIGSDLNWEVLLRNPSLDQNGVPVPGPNVDTIFTGSGAVAAFNSVGGASLIGGKVPVENDKTKFGRGSLDSHWRESVFDDELMSPLLDVGTNPLSVVTVAALEDIGYTVNREAADAYTLPSSRVVQLRSRGRKIVLGDDIWRGPLYTADPATGRVTRLR